MNYFIKIYESNNSINKIFKIDILIKSELINKN